MNVSYKMVIIGLLLLAPPGARQDRAPERAGVGMARAPRMEPKEVLHYLTGAPRQAFADSIELSPTIWEALAGLTRAQLVQMAVHRLQQYYALHLGYQTDFGNLLREAAKVL